MFPAEIERVIAAHPAVAMVAVGRAAGRAEGRDRQGLRRAEARRDGDADGIIALCREQLAAYKVPRSVQFVPDLPKT